MLRSAPLAAALSLFTPLALLGGCSADTPTVHVSVTVGQEADTFSRDPQVVSVEVRGVDPSGFASVVATAAPGGTLDFGDVDNTAQLTFEVTGVDAQGNKVVRGQSLGAIPVSAVSGAIPVFAQRVNQWARPPGALNQTHTGGVAAVGAERFLVLGGGALDKGGVADEVEVYDLFALAGTGLGGLTSQPGTMIPRGTAMLFAGQNGAMSIDFGTGESSITSVPSGLGSYADVAGGRPVDASDGRTFVVGGSRASGPTQAVLVAAADGTLSSLQLTTARAGAAVVWVEGVGLVVAGGSATGAGVEVLGPKSTSFAALTGFPPDATVGAGAVIDGPTGVVLLGGTLDGAPVAAPVRRLDPTCVNACEATPIAGSDPGVALTSVHAFALGGSRILAVGDEPTAPGQTHSFLLQLGVAATELPLREPRSGAAVVPAPNGTLALLGGTRLDGKPALSVELFFPQ